jgi:hypothetical protein
MWTVIVGVVCLFVGAAFPITLNRIRRKILSGKFFGKLESGQGDPTSAKGSQ